MIDIEGRKEKSRLDLSEFEVIRQEYIFSQETPMVTFRKGRIHVNKYALNLFPNHDYIQLLIKRETKELVICPVKKGTKDSFRWASGQKRNPRHIKCTPLYYLLFQMMDWDMDCRYRICGTEEEEQNGEKAIYFSLMDAVRYMRDEDIPSYPEEWALQFGTKKSEHKQENIIDRFEDDAIFSVELPVSEKNIVKTTQIEEVTDHAE